MMIFDLPPILGFIPLLIYLVFCFRGADLVLSAGAALLAGIILTGQTPQDVGNLLYSALGSFVTLVGVIIMLGGGLGEILRDTKVAQNMVHFTVNKLNVRTPKQGMAITFIITTAIVGLLGTLAGGTAVLAPVLVPIAATIGMYPGTLALMMVMGGISGMLVGPFTPTAVTIRTLSNITIGEYYIGLVIPLVLLSFIVFYIWAIRLQKNGGDGEAYTEEDKVSSDNFAPTPQINRSTIVFLIVMTILVIYGIITNAGAAYAIVIMMTTAVVVGLFAGKSVVGVIQTFCTGAGKMFHMFLLFVFFGPVLDLIAASGAYDALLTYLKPVFGADKQAAFILISSAVGIWGISGAAVAQCQIIYDLFYPISQSLGVSDVLWGNVILYGSVLTSLAVPNSDVMGPLSFAHSQNLKVVVKAGYCFIAIALIVLAVRAMIKI